MFLTNIADIVSATQTWFTTEWPNFCQKNYTFGYPLVSGTLDPLLMEGTTTIGDCRVACGTARLVELTGLSSLTLANPNVVFKTCTRSWEAHIHFPLASAAFSSKVTSYSTNSQVASQSVYNTLNVTSSSGTLVLIVPMKQLASTSYFFDFTNAEIQMNLSLTFAKVNNSYIDAALDTQASQFLKALRSVCKRLPLWPSLKSTLGSTVLTKRTLTMTIDPWVPQTCTLSGPCHPCDTCCICMTTQTCSDSCMNCDCIDCESKPTYWKLVFFLAVVFVGFAVIFKQK